MTQRFLPYSPERDVYRLLQVDPRAGTDEVLDAWRRLARTFHPDRNDSGRANEEMQVVNAVRQLMTDPAARSHYDRERQRWYLRRRSSGDAADAPAASSAVARGRAVARALLIGFGAFAAELTPAWCRACGSAMNRQDAYCSHCGARAGAARLR